MGGRQLALSDEHDGDKGIAEVTAAAHIRPAKTFTGLSERDLPTPQNQVYCPDAEPRGAEEKTL